jgi:hypothetical protein
MSPSIEARMFRRGFYLSELIPLLAAAAMLGTALFGLLTGRVPWLSGTLYLLGGVVLGIMSLRTLRGH